MQVGVVFNRPSNVGKDRTDKSEHVWRMRAPRMTSDTKSDGI
jgi:hypothetical protein